MKKIEIEIKLIIRFYDSFFFGGGTGTGEIQSYLMRDMDGFPYISGAALKGCIAEYAQALSQLVPEFNHYEKLFGTGGVQQGSMYFENGNLIDKAEYSDMQESLLEFRTGVSISRYTKAKKEGHLYTMELGGRGGKLAFQSSIHGFLDSEIYQEDIACLVAAIRLIFALGGKRSAGLGWLISPIECQVLKGERGQEAGKSGQESIDPEEVNRWIKDWIGGRKCMN